ncbi:MAG: FliH/SctL family protein [Planctomycetota bacterium]
MVEEQAPPASDGGEQFVELARLEREVEERLRSRYREMQVAAQEREDETRRKLRALEIEAGVAARKARDEARTEGRKEGFRAGFAKGAEEGRRLGIEQGRISGTREGRDGAWRDEISRVRPELDSSLSALRNATDAFHEGRRQLLEESRRNVVELATRTAEKIISREVSEHPEVILESVRRAVAQIFRGCEAVLHLHPDDVDLVQSALGASPAWAEDLRDVRLHASTNVTRGGCRLVSGAGVVDVTIESQLELVHDSLLSVPLDEPDPISPTLPDVFAESDDGEVGASESEELLRGTVEEPGEVAGDARRVAKIDDDAETRDVDFLKSLTVDEVLGDLNETRIMRRPPPDETTGRES